MLAKRSTIYDNKGASPQIVKDEVRYRLWAEYSTKAEAEKAVQFAKKHGNQGFYKRYMSKWHNPVYAYYTAFKKK